MSSGRASYASQHLQYNDFLIFEIKQTISITYKLITLKSRNYLHLAQALLLTIARNELTPVADCEFSDR